MCTSTCQQVGFDWMWTFSRKFLFTVSSEHPILKTQSALCKSQPVPRTLTSVYTLCTDKW